MLKPKVSVAFERVRNFQFQSDFGIGRNTLLNYKNSANHAFGASPKDRGEA